MRRARWLRGPVLGVTAPRRAARVRLTERWHVSRTPGAHRSIRACSVLGEAVHPSLTTFNTRLRGFRLTASTGRVGSVSSGQPLRLGGRGAQRLPGHRRERSATYREGDSELWFSVDGQDWHLIDVPDEQRPRAVHAVGVGRSASSSSAAPVSRCRARASTPTRRSRKVAFAPGSCLTATLPDLGR